MTAHGAASVLITALERTWAEIRDRHEEVPEAILITGTGRKGARLSYGHWRPELWQTADRGVYVPEVFVSGECLLKGGHEVLLTLLHEAAHGVAFGRGVKDTSRGNHYHNKRFLEVSKELGLSAPEVPCKKLGWSNVGLPEETAALYESLPQLTEALTVIIGPPPLAEPAKPQPKYGCECGRIIRMGRKAFEEAAIMCGLCNRDFEEINVDE